VHEPDPQLLPVLDDVALTELSASVQGDRSFVVELIDAYLADGPAHVDAIEAAVAADDAVALVRPAHTLKSSSATVGASRLAARSRGLEKAGRTGVIGPEARDSAGWIRAEWEAAATALRTWADSGGME
jgi:HPt (histidine-containing phosphotransfer) domain-containing protein